MLSRDPSTISDIDVDSTTEYSSDVRHSRSSAESCIVVALILFAACRPIIADEVSPDIEATHEIGSFTRRWLVFDIYRVTFHTTDPDDVVRRFLAGRPAPDRATPSNPETRRALQNALAQYVLDPQNHIPVKLSIQVRQNSHMYSVEQRYMRNTLTLAGYPVDDAWRLIDGDESQEDLILYVGHMLGMDPDLPGRYFVNRAKGDTYELVIDSANAASVRYRPAPGNRAAQAGSIHFLHSDFLRAIMATYIIFERCSEELRSQLPDALMEGLQESYRRQTAD